MLLVCLLTASCDSTEQVASAPQHPVPSVDADDFPYCGGVLKPGAATAYFHRLEDHLKVGDAPVPMNFYGAQIGIESGGKYTQFNRDDFRPGARALLTNLQWREILDRGYGDLKSIGWRGCVLADGKAAFQAVDGELVLSSFDKDRAWAPSRRAL